MIEPNNGNNPNNESNAGNNETAAGSRAVKYLIVYFIFGLGLTWLFSNYLKERHNPNQQPQTSIDSDGHQSVVLIRNPYGHYVSNGKINGQEVQFLLDTGATDVSIPQHTANSIGLYKGTELLVNTANGVARVYATRIDSIEIGNIKLYDINAHINPNVEDDDILLGMSFLKHLEFTQRGKQLTLRQVPLY